MRPSVQVVKRAVWVAIAAVAALGALHPWSSVANEPTVNLLQFTEDEMRAIQAHGPWPVPWVRDPSNRVSGDEQAIALGERLFFENRLSSAGRFSCATCHEPERNWTDNQTRGTAIGQMDRNTPTLMNVRMGRWFGWDGGSDSLWSQSIRPILEPRELGANPRHVAELLRNDVVLSCHYSKVFGVRPSVKDDEAVLVDVGKALAAFQETIVSGRTPFDEFRDALARGDVSAASRYPDSAQRGLRIFIGKGGCDSCHSGPNFTNGEFHDTGNSHFTAKGRVDPGRHEGIKRVTESRFNLLGPYNDDATRASATSTRHVALEHRNFGEFKVPTLRNTVMTSPYMHHGEVETLGQVVRHYSEMNLDRLHADGEQILKPLKLSQREQTDLVVFLESLTNFTMNWRRNLGDGPYCD